MPVEQSKLERNVSKPRQAPVYDWSWFIAGMKNFWSVPAFVLMAAFVGYGGIARDAGLSLGAAAFSVPTIWALPSHLVLVAGVASGASLLTIIVAVVLVSVRMTPMTMAIVPELRVPRSSKWHLIFASSFVAMTAWVHLLERAPELPRNARLPYFLGFASVLIVGATSVTVVTYLVAGTLPILLMACLYFLTPLYFAASMWNTARVWAEKLSLVLGFCLGPVFAFWWPETNVLLAGLVGGVLGFAGYWFSQHKNSAS